MVIDGQSFHAFVEATVVELSKSEATEILEFHSPSEPHPMCRVTFEIQDGVCVQEVMKEGLDDDGLAEARPSVARVDDLLKILFKVYLEELHPGEDHPSSFFPHLLSSVLFQVVMREDMSVLLEKLIGGLDVLFIISG